MPRPVADVSPHTIGYVDEEVATYFFHCVGDMYHGEVIESAKGTIAYLDHTG